jgi:hypothetical protein
MFCICIQGHEITNVNEFVPKNVKSQNFRRNNSDGSDRDDVDAEIENMFYSDGFDSTNSESTYSTNVTNDEDDTYNSTFMPKISIRNKLFRLDLVTPKLINCMNDSEKENYINICRQLYSEIYDT